MLTDLVPVEVDPKAAGRDFWKRYHASRRVRHAETRPGDPLTPDDVVEANMQRDDPFSFHYRYEIARNGVMLSWFSAITARPGSPGYESNKHLMWASGSVHPDHRRHGLGRMWVPIALELMERHGCTVIGAGTEEDSGHAFLKWLGAEGKMRGGENRLRLVDVDWSLVRRWVDEGPKRSPESQLEVYDGRLPRAMWEDFCPQFSSLLNTIPWEQLDHGDNVYTPAQLAETYARLDLSNESHHVMLTREPDGGMSGVTDMYWAPHHATIAYQAFTGVRPSGRGRGLGKWLKAAMLQHMHEIHPEVEWFVTENAASNAPMLAINKKLGFKQYRAGVEYQISREKLAARAQELAGRLPSPHRQGGASGAGSARPGAPRGDLPPQMDGQGGGRK